jgi:hypothetical protein
MGLIVPLDVPQKPCQQSWGGIDLGSVSAFLQARRDILNNAASTENLGNVLDFQHTIFSGEICQYTDSGCEMRLTSRDSSQRSSRIFLSRSTLPSSPTAIPHVPEIRNARITWYMPFQGPN